MLPRTHLLISIIALMLITSALYCQETNETAPDSTSIMISNLATNVLNLLYTGDYMVSYSINWEVFVLDGVDYSGDYWDAYDWEEEDYFIEEMIATIGKELHYDGDSEDKFVGWAVVKGEETFTVTCHNQKKNVKMVLQPDASGSAYITEINISDITD